MEVPTRRRLDFGTILAGIFVIITTPVWLLCMLPGLFIIWVFLH